MGQNHTVVDLEKYRASQEGSTGSPEKEPRPITTAVPEVVHPHTYTEIQIPDAVKPYITVHQQNPEVSEEVRKLGVEPTETTPVYREHAVLEDLGLSVQKVLAFLKGTPAESSSWLGHHAHRQLKKGGNTINIKTGVVEKKAA